MAEYYENLRGVVNSNEFVKLPPEQMKNLIAVQRSLPSKAGANLTWCGGRDVVPPKDGFVRCSEVEDTIRLFKETYLDSMPKLNVFEQAIMNDYLNVDCSGGNTLLSGAESLRVYFDESGIRSSRLRDLKSTFYQEFEKSLIDLHEYLNGNLRFAPNNIQKLLGRKAPLSVSPLPSDELIARVKESTMESFDEVTGRDINRGGNFDHLKGGIINVKFSSRDYDYFVIGRKQEMSSAEKKAFSKKHDEFWKQFNMHTMPLGRGIFRAARKEFSESIKEKTGVCISNEVAIAAGPREGEDILVFKWLQSPDNDDIRELVKASEYTPEPIDKPIKKHQEENPQKMEWQTIDPEGLQGQRFFVVYPEDVSEGRPLPMCVEGRLTNDGKAYVCFSDSNRIIPEDGLIMVKNRHCNIYEAFNRKTFDLLFQMNPDGTASRKKQSETMKPGMRKKSSLKK